MQNVMNKKEQGYAYLCLILRTPRREAGRMSEVRQPLSGISGLSFDSPFPISSLVFLPSFLALSVLAFLC